MKIVALILAILGFMAFVIILSLIAAATQADQCNKCPHKELCDKHDAETPDKPFTPPCEKMRKMYRPSTDYSSMKTGRNE